MKTLHLPDREDGVYALVVAVPVSAAELEDEHAHRRVLARLQARGMQALAHMEIRDDLMETDR